MHFDREYAQKSSLPGFGKNGAGSRKTDYALAKASDIIIRAPESMRGRGQRYSVDGVAGGFRLGEPWPF